MAVAKFIVCTYLNIFPQFFFFNQNHLIGKNTRNPSTLLLLLLLLIFSLSLFPLENLNPNDGKIIIVIVHFHLVNILLFSLLIQTTKKNNREEKRKKK